ncbi:MAG: hypothetical protein JWP99_1612, partial [Devosia sp.]|nr:hypothetical protein [Devosia sp.]
RQAIANLEVQFGAARVTMSVSIGIAEAAAGEDNPQTLLHDADTALLAAKKLGRNCIVCAPGRALSAAE